MKEKALISIILPVYNVKKYLTQCVSSIIKQTFQQWELIIVDDGSTDGSSELCDEFAVQDNRIKVIHKPNTGLSDSRNVAFATAEADIIGYVDADDWIEPDMYEILYQTMMQNDADISICGLFWSYKNKEKASCKGGETNVYTREEALNLILEDKVIQSYVCNKLFRRHVIEAMPKSIYFEDIAVVFKYFMKSNKIAFTQVPKYHYRQRVSSIVNDIDPKKQYQYFLAVQERYNYIKNQTFLNFEINKEENKFRVVIAATKASKEIARRSNDKAAALLYLEKIKENLKQYQPVRICDIGFKAYLRLAILQISVPLYYSLARFTKLFSHNKKRKNLYE